MIEHSRKHGPFDPRWPTHRLAAHELVRAAQLHVQTEGPASEVLVADGAARSGEAVLARATR
jgi:hypothetical protein